MKPGVGEYLLITIHLVFYGNHTAARRRDTQVVNNGAGNLPGAAYNSGSHTNTLVPFFAKGADADLFTAYLTGSDPQMATRYGIDSAFNSFIDNTDIFKVMEAANAPVPEPSVVWLFGFGIAGLAAFRWKEAA
jgi:alkaline phosphatase